MERKFNYIISRQEKLLEKNRGFFNVIGYIKLLLVLVLCISLYFTYKNNYGGKLVLVVVAELTVIITIWIYHEKLHQKIDYSAGIININKRHLDRLSGKWTAFSDMGEEFINPEHPYACDLDVVGKKSLFQFLTNAKYLMEMVGII